jgi:pyruvate kinase
MKPVIVATQMLDSMIRNPIPTRAEVSDVANAVYDSADAVMLSGETASGKYPLEAVEVMNKILKSTEKNENYANIYTENPSLANAVAHSVTHIASEIKAKAIFTGAITGNSARIISFFRPKTTIIAITNEERVAQQLALVWGVIPFIVKNKNIKTAKDLLLPGVTAFKENEFLSKGDKIVYRYHEKLGDSSSANTITVKSIE